MKTKIAYFMMFAILLTACGKDSKSAAAPSKELFSVWTSNVDNAVMDLTNGSFGLAQTYSGVLSSGEICDCDLSLIGTQSSGNWVLANCTYRAGTGGGVDPGCAGGNDNGSYTNTSAILTLTFGDGSTEAHR